MESWLPPNVPPDIWDPKNLLQLDVIDASQCQVQFVFGTGDTRAYSADMCMGQVVRMTVWCDGVTEAVWGRDHDTNGRPTAWRLISH